VEKVGTDAAAKKEREERNISLLFGKKGKRGICALPLEEGHASLRARHGDGLFTRKWGKKEMGL